MSPRIQIQIYNKNNDGTLCDQFTCVPHTTLYKLQELKINQSQFQKFKLDEVTNMPKIKYSYMKITLSNPLHHSYPVELGLQYLIIIAKHQYQQKSELINLSAKQLQNSRDFEEKIFNTPYKDGKLIQQKPQQSPMISEQQEKVISVLQRGGDQRQLKIMERAFGVSSATLKGQQQVKPVNRMEYQFKTQEKAVNNNNNLNKNNQSIYNFNGKNRSENNESKNQSNNLHNNNNNNQQNYFELEMKKAMELSLKEYKFKGPEEEIVDETSQQFQEKLAKAIEISKQDAEYNRETVNCVKKTKKNIQSTLDKFLLPNQQEPIPKNPPMFALTKYDLSQDYWNLYKK